LNDDHELTKALHEHWTSSKVQGLFIIILALEMQIGRVEGGVCGE